MHITLEGRDSQDLLSSCWLEFSNVCREASIDCSGHGHVRDTGAGKGKKIRDRGRRRIGQAGSQGLQAGS